MELKSLLRLRKRRTDRASRLAGSSALSETNRLDPAPGSQAEGIPGVHDPHQTRRILIQRRIDCDRAGTTLSLLAFDAPQDRSTEALSLLASVLSWRMSPSGSLGLLDAGQLGVVLPDTSISAAHAVARETLEATAKHRKGEFDYSVFVYPSHELAAEAVTSADTAEEMLPAQPMELLFARHTPRWKRLIDIVGATLGIVLLSPLLLAVAVAIKLGSPGPVLFVQDREGIGGRRFKILKFRTMYVDAEQQKEHLHDLNQRDGPAFKIRNDPRATPLGQILRRTCIDELPQLWNVLKGEMSLVGPRPLPWDESRACARSQRRRLDVAPGLTCTWQVHGGFDQSFDDWMRMDVEYAENVSFWTDMKLILQTMWRLVLLRGAH